MLDVVLKEELHHKARSEDVAKVYGCANDEDHNKYQRTVHTFISSRSTTRPGKRVSVT